ncbi:MAG: hypothetical protein J5950_00730 [Clostridia bacterium]|nr:hypothetical protein [Clostridia bacterium]
MEKSKTRVAEIAATMTSKEIIKRIVAHDEPPRFGFDFANLTDFRFVGTRRYINLPPNPYNAWGDYPELKAITGFNGEVRRDVFGNIYGRFNGKTKGECIRGVIQDWDDYTFKMPEFDPNFRETLLAMNFAGCEKYVLGAGSSLFSVLRDARLIANALMDTITDPDKVAEFVDMLAEHEAKVIKSVAGCGIDGWFFCDDLGTQESTFMSPASFRELFKPAYHKVAEAAHEAGVAIFMHSCGNNYGLIEDLIDAGVDVFQFDQPDVYPTEVLAHEFADRVSFYAPVDIQKVLPTGDREIIESRAKRMCELFREAGGGWIAKDYPSYGDIGVEKEWAAWAQNVIVENSFI